MHAIRGIFNCINKHIYRKIAEGRSARRFLWTTANDAYTNADATDCHFAGEGGSTQLPRHVRGQLAIPWQAPAEVCDRSSLGPQRLSLSEEDAIAEDDPW